MQGRRCNHVPGPAGRMAGPADRVGWQAPLAACLVAALCSAVRVSAQQPPAEPPAGAPAETGLREVGRGRAPLAKVTSGSGKLPNDAGQIYREYDISHYSLRVASTHMPEQAIIDWILRDTGYEAWHTGPVVGLLHADSRVLRVYHTAEMQAMIGEIVDRFVNPDTESYAFGVKIVSVDSPNWRGRATRVLRPVPVQSQGVQAWLLAREDAALLLADLRRRSDYREHSAPHLMVNNGQSAVVSATKPRRYTRGVLPSAAAWPAFEPESAQIDEGFTFQLSPLLSLDGLTVDAVVKCNIDQIERMATVNLETPSTADPRQQTRIEVPQLVQCRFHERFRWPTDQVLVIGLGLVATPVPADPGLFGLPVNLPVKLPQALTPPERADLLVFIESRGSTTAPSAAGQPTASAPGPTGRPASLGSARY